MNQFDAYSTKKPKETQSMNAKQFEELLASLSACKEAKVWARGKSLKTVWKTCERGDWLLWLCGKMADTPGWPTRKEVVLAACDCAETALKYVNTDDDDDGPRKCIETVRAWAAGTATLDDVIGARKLASASSAAASYAASARTKALATHAVMVRKRLTSSVKGAR